MRGRSFPRSQKKAIIPKTAPIKEPTSWVVRSLASAHSMGSRQLTPNWAGGSKYQAITFGAIQLAAPAPASMPTTAAPAIFQPLEESFMRAMLAQTLVPRNGVLPSASEPPRL